MPGSRPETTETPASGGAGVPLREAVLSGHAGGDGVGLAPGRADEPGSSARIRQRSGPHATNSQRIPRLVLRDFPCPHRSLRIRRLRT